MNLALLFGRLFFLALSLFFMTTFMLSSNTGSSLANALIGLGLGGLLFALFLGFDLAFKKFHLRSLNAITLGLFFGYLMGQGLMIIFDAVLDLTSMAVVLQPQSLEIIKISIFLFGIYLATMMTLKYSEEIYFSIPFVRFSQTEQKKKDLILDPSILGDPRLIDLANSGLVDNALIMPRFVIKDLQSQVEMRDELCKAKARKSLELIKKLEGLPNLGLRFANNDYPEVLDLTQKLLRLARAIDANILSSDLTQVQLPPIEGINIINMHFLANSLKPLMQAGEQLKIKVQRYGKEAMQGVGYLEDGTMVVINGGGDYIGETIDAQVLSVKHTSSGRMIFCNVREDDALTPHYAGENSDE